MGTSALTTMQMRIFLTCLPFPFSMMGHPWHSPTVASQCLSHYFGSTLTSVTVVHACCQGCKSWLSLKVRCLDMERLLWMLCKMGCFPWNLWFVDLVTFEISVQVEFTSTGSREMTHNSTVSCGSETMEFVNTLSEATGFYSGLPMQASEYNEYVHQRIWLRTQNMFHAITEGGKKRKMRLMGLEKGGRKIRTRLMWLKKMPT